MTHHANQPVANHLAHDPASYGDSFADVYDEWYSSLDDDDFVESFARHLPETSARILELGAGTGRLLEKLHSLRRNRHDAMVGIDASDKMLDVARTRGVGRIAELVLGDFSGELPAGPFDAIFVGYNTLFNLPDEASIASCLSHVATSLAPHGYFMTDLVIPVMTETNEHSTIRTMANGDTVVSVSRVEPTTRTISGYFGHLVDGVETVRRPWNVHYLAPEELDALAVHAGLTLVERTADGNGSAFSADASRHISRYVLSSSTSELSVAPLKRPFRDLS